MEIENCVGIGFVYCDFSYISFVGKLIVIIVGEDDLLYVVDYEVKCC